MPKVVLVAPPPPAASTSVQTPYLGIVTPIDSLPMLDPAAIDPGRTTQDNQPRKPRTLLANNLHVFINLLMTVIGAGMLSLPFTFAVVPTAQAITMTVVVGLCMAVTAHALLHAHAHVATKEEQHGCVGAGNDFASYRSMGIQVAGKRFGNAVSIVMVTGIFGGCVGGIRIVKDMMPHICSLLYEAMSTTRYDELESSDQSFLQTSLLWGIFVLLILPLCALKSLSALKATNYLGFACSLVLVVAVAYRSSTHIPQTQVSVDSTFARMAQSISIYSYAFTMHLNVLPLFVQLRGKCGASVQASTARMTQCISVVTLLCVALYLLLGVYAARLYGGSTQGNILVNMQQDAFMQVPLIAVFATVLLSFPPLFHPGRVLIQELVANRPAATLPWKSRTAAAAGYLLAQLLVAVWVPGIEIVFALVGASTTVLICYVFPVVMFTRLCPWRGLGWRGWLWCGVLWLIVAFVVVMGARTIIFLLGGQ